MSRRGGGRGSSLRRGGGGAPAPFVPSDFGTVAWWLRGDDVTLNGADVSSWNDKSGNARHWTQGTAARQPLFVASAVNGRPGVTFDAVNTEFLTGPNLVTVGLTAAESFLVLQVLADPPPTAPRSGLWTTSGAAGDTGYTRTDGTIRDSFGTTAMKVLGNPAPSITIPHILRVHTVASDWELSINETSILATATNTVGWAATSHLGQSATAAVSYLDGTICEWLVYTAKLSAGNRAIVMAYLKARYGIA